MTAYELGRAAGRPIVGTACPFKPGTFEADQWLSGYADQRARNMRQAAKISRREIAERPQRK
jgi:hypothetical protein